MSQLLGRRVGHSEWLLVWGRPRRGGHQCLHVLYQSEAIGRCVMLMPPSRFANQSVTFLAEVLFDDIFWLLGVGWPELALYHILQAASIINQCTSPDYADDTVVRGSGQDTHGVGEWDSLWL